jgi:hypothetical protein
MHRKPFLILAFVLVVGLLLPPPHSAQQPPPPPQQSTPPPPTPDASQAPPAGQNPTVIQSRVNLVDILFTVLNRAINSFLTSKKLTSKFLTTKLHRKFATSASRPIFPCV